MSNPKFAADRISRQFIPGQTEEEDYSESYDSSENAPEPAFNPSRLRSDAVPTDGDYAGQKVSRADIEKVSDHTESDESDDDYDDDDSPDFDDLPVPAPEGADELEDQLAELEADEGESLVDSLRKQQEADLRIAHGTKMLNKQYSALVLLRLKMQSVLSAVNMLPPTAAPENPLKSPYNAAAQDPEVRELLAEIGEMAEKLVQEIHELKTELENIYEWENTDEIASNMIEIIAHWGQRLKLSSGMRHGTVINRPIEQQIEAALNNREALVQPSRHRDPNEKVFGLKDQPEIMNEIYNDYGWYKRVVAESIGTSVSTNTDEKVTVKKPKKQMIRSKQIHYDVIPEIQHFMSATMTPIPDYVDALFNSLFQRKE